MFAAVLPGCAALQAGGRGGASDVPQRDLRVARVLAEEGFKKLEQGQYEEASRVFNAGLKFEPENAQLHFFNALTYHLLYLRGDDAMKDLAATGYALALAADPAHYYAALQAGRLEYRARRYDKAIESFRHAAGIEPERGDAYLGLAAAGYYAHDLTTARDAAERAVRLSPGSAEASRAAAMIYAALGEGAKAREALARYTLLERNRNESAQLERRLNQWRAWHSALQSSPRAAPPQTVAQAAAPASGAAPSQPAAKSAAPSPAAGPAGREPAMPRWFDCDALAVAAAAAAAAATTSTTDTSSDSSGSSSYTYTGDEATPLPALPVTCKGAGNPHMAILDVAIIRTEDNTTTSYGINLLNGLTYVLNNGFGITDVITSPAGGTPSRTVTITRQRSQGFPVGGITYSLNIANSTDSRSEVLARPSLVALDRKPSTFFSGRNVTLGIAGQAGGASTLADRPVGVSLAVTPTFIDDETLLVSVRAARSFLEQVDFNVSFGQSMQTSRNSVTANVALKFGQTLILSGLSEREVERSSAGVPVLQDIPLLQYLFRNKTTQNFTRSVLVLITPRKPLTDRAEMLHAIEERQAGKGGRYSLLHNIEEHLKHTQSASPNLDTVYSHQLDNSLYLQFRSGDVNAENWIRLPRLEQFFRDIAGLAYF